MHKFNMFTVVLAKVATKHNKPLRLYELFNAYVELEGVGVFYPTDALFIMLL